MTETPGAGRQAYGDIAPALGDYTDGVLFGDLWKRPDLSPRDRSLATISALIALYRHNELGFHVRKGLENGLTREEIIELITHMAFYAGWPVANTAIGVVRAIFSEQADPAQ